MKFTIHEIEKTVHKRPFTFDHEIDVKELESLNDEIRKAKPARVQGECIVEGKEFIFSLRINGVLILPCARSLVDVPYSYQINTTEIFTTSPHLNKEDEEDEIQKIEGHVIDLKPLILQDILLNKPYRVFSKDSSNHIDFEGEGWKLTIEDEEKTTEEQDDSVDPRLEKLKSLLEDKKNK